jgi:Domain of unknown function (DUF1707)
MLVADRDRDRVATALREHYASGRLTLEEFSSRTHLVLIARSDRDLRSALLGLPGPLLPGHPWPAGSLVRAAARGAALVAATGAYLLFSVVLLLVLTLTVLLQGASGTTLAGFLVVWLVPTYLLSRLWRRPPRRRLPRM